MTQEKISTFISTFSKFLDPKLVDKLIYSKKGSVKKLKSLEDLLKLPISSFRFLDEQEAKVLEDLLDVNDISEAAKLNKDNPFDKLMDLESTADPIKATEMREQLKEQIGVLKEKFPTLEKSLKKAISISALILDISNESKSIDIEHKEQKIITLGLENAGKTAILSKFGGKLGIADLANLKPTKGIDRQHLKTEKLDLIIWDFGGQREYRKRYIEFPEKYFFQLDLLIYVLDSQDSEKFDESFEYFDKILEILINLEENPYMLIFLHKYDPDLKNDPEILLNIEYLKDKIKEVFDSKKYNFDYEIYLTSIYSLISNEPEFSKYIKEIMRSNVSINLSDPTIRKVEGLGGILEETMNALIRLSESISIQLSNLDERLVAIECGAVKMSQNGKPFRIEGQGTQHREYNVRSSVLGELRDLFAKKKKLNL